MCVYIIATFAMTLALALEAADCFFVFLLHFNEKVQSCRMHSFNMCSTSVVSLLCFFFFFKALLLMRPPQMIGWRRWRSSKSQLDRHQKQLESSSGSSSNDTGLELIWLKCTFIIIYCSSHMETDVSTRGTKLYIWALLILLSWCIAPQILAYLLGKIIKNTRLCAKERL